MRVLFIFLIVFGTIMFLVFYRAGPQLVLINDVTTSPLSAPDYHVLLQDPANEGRDMSLQPSTAEAIREAYPDLVPKASKLSKGELFERVRQVAELQENWKIVSVRPQDLRIEAIATTPWMKYKDDVVIEVRDHPSGSAVHMRSKSRVGTGDVGTNAARIRDFLNQLDLDK